MCENHTLLHLLAEVRLVLCQFCFTINKPVYNNYEKRNRKEDISLGQTSFKKKSQMYVKELYHVFIYAQFEYYTTIYSMIFK